MADTTLGTLVWELEVRTQRAKAEQEAIAAGRAAGKAFEQGANLESAGQKGAREWVTSLSKDLQTRREDIRREAISGLTTGKEAGLAGRAAAASYAKELRGGLDALRTKGVIGTGDFPALLGQGSVALKQHTLETGRLAVQLNSVERATGNAGNGLARLRGPLTQLATSALGTRTNVGQLASSLALLGFGATLTIGITAGIAAIAFAYGKLTEGSRKLREETNKAIESLEKLQRLAPAAQLSANISATQIELNARRTALSRLQAASDFSSPAGDPAVLPGTLEKRAAEIRRLQGLIATGEAELRALRQRSAMDSVRSFTEDLASLIRSNKATAEQISNARILLAAWNSDFEKLGKSDVQGRAALQSMIGTLQGAFDALEKADERAAKAGDRAADARVRAREAFDAAIAAKTPGKEDDLESQIRRLTFAAKEAGLGATEIGSRVAALRAAFGEAAKVTQEKLATQLRDITAATTITAVDDLENALADLVKTMKAEDATEGLIEKVKALQQPVIDATARSEALQAVLERIKGDTEEGFNLVGNLEELDGRIAKATSARDTAKAGTTAQRAAQADLDELLKIELEIREKIEALRLKTVKHSATVREQTIQLAGDISNAANAAFGLASAFLGVDANITKALGSIGQLAGGINAALSAKNLLSAIPGIGQALGGALALASSLFGKDPAIERARQETLEGMKSLRAALVELRDVYLQDVSTSTIKADIRNIEKIFAGTSGERILQPGEGNGPGRRGNLRTIGRTIGQDFDSGALLAYFKELDRKYGTNLASFIEREDPYGLLQAMRELPGALKVELSELGKFANDAAGVIAKVNYGLDLMGNSNAADRFRATIKGLLAAGIDLGEFADEMAELSDPTTSAERIAEIVDYVLGRLEAGGANFGGLTPEELRELFKQGVDARRAESGGTGGFNVSTQITEVTGSRLGGLLTTGNIFAQQTADNTALIARILAMTANIGPIGPPPLNLPSGGMGGTTINFTGDFNFTINGEAATPDVAKRLGKAFTDAAVAEMDKRLGERVRWMKRVNGDLT